ncbi:uncharacterized mitochondrial protein AtMg00310-like [Rutidosis leptorrhynchoides]|uniref:uncharacterized mitochondrial protein AtMg00310-like n=1 Tax=Rutidosis leptorrhynchoides TaxID=125765 RepID=UPI003A994B0D
MHSQVSTFAMILFKLPKEFCESLEMYCAKFFWGTKEGHRKMHWASWKRLSAKKKDGGLGFQSLEAYNLALIAKQGWRVITNPESLVARLLKDKYFKSSYFLRAELGRFPTDIWRTLLDSRAILLAVGMWIGNVHEIVTSLILWSLLKI